MHSKKSFCATFVHCALIFTSVWTFAHAGVRAEKRTTGCSQDFEFLNGFTTFIENENVVLFECENGFVPYGSMKATCVNGNWDMEPPKCIKKGCGQLKIPIHGSIEEEYSGALVKFQCDAGYKLNGSSTLTCDGRQWSAVPPVCDALPREVVKNAALNKTDL